MNYEQYYPTPAELGNKLAKLINKPQPPILEPSAGTGDLIQAFIAARKFNRWEHHYSEKDFHCVELNADRAATLKGNEFIVVWDDFLTFNPLMPYRTIIMNPPFHDGAKHLQKALHILADGGEIACILNAETIRNPCTNERKALIRQLEAAENYHVEFVQSAFDTTDVEIALIYVKKAEAVGHCATFDNFKKSVIAEREAQPQMLMRTGEINALIDCYRAEVKAALHLYDEIFSIKLNSHSKVKGGLILCYELDHLLTSDACRDFPTRLSITTASAFTFQSTHLHSATRQHARLIHAPYGANNTQLIYHGNRTVSRSFLSIDAAIMKVWNNFTHRFSTDNTANIHYYSGWRTNKAFKCNKKVIIPLYAFDYIGERIDLYKVRDELADIEKAMCYLDCGRTEASEMAEQLMAAREQDITRGIDTKFFIVDVYKKGTCHLTFKDADLLKKFNLYCGRKLHWLPDDYGRKPYESLSKEERIVADSFEGRDSYTETYRNQQFYLPSNSSLPMLTAD